MKRFARLLGLWALTLGRAQATVQLCTTDSPCIGETVVCNDADDACIARCMDAGVCENITIVCGPSATKNCGLRCEDTGACRGAYLQSERETSIQCSGDYSCANMAASVGRDTDNLELTVSCSAAHSCEHSRFQLHSEGGDASVHCEDLGSGSESCDDLSLSCDMSATGNCETTSGGQYACTGADANSMICANSALCTADSNCFTLTDTATISFIISDGITTSTDCVGGVHMGEDSELNPNGLLACASLDDALAKCYELTQTGALAQWATDEGLSMDVSTAEADSCEFLFATFDGQPVAVASTSLFAVDYEYGFDAHFFPWQLSENTAVRTALTDAGAVETSPVGVELSGSFLKLSNVNVDAFFEMRSLEFSAASELSEAFITATTVPHTAFQLADISMNGIQSTTDQMYFESVGFLDVVDGVFTDNTADGSLIFARYGVVAMDSCNVAGNSVKNGAIRVKSAEMTLKHSTFSDNSATAKAGAVYASDSTLFAELNTFDGNHAVKKGGAVAADSSSIVFIADSTFVGNNADKEGGALHAAASETTVYNCTFTQNSADSASGGAMFSSGSGALYASLCTFTENNADFGAAMYGSGGGQSIEAVNCEFTENTGDYGAGMYSNEAKLSASDCTMTANHVDLDGAAVYVYKSNALASLSNCVLIDNIAEGSGGALYSLTTELNASMCEFTANNAGTNGGAVTSLTSAPVSLFNCKFTANIASGNGGALHLSDISPFYASLSTITGNRGTKGGGVYADFRSPVWLSDSNLTDNFASEIGGALYLYDDCELESSNCRFAENTASDRGGAVFADYECAVSDTHSTFSGNNATNGGALFCTEECEFVKSLFDANGVPQNGGGVYVMTSFSSTKCTYSHNFASKGGSVFLEADTFGFVTNATVFENFAALGGFMASGSHVSVFIGKSSFTLNDATRGGAFVLSEASIFRSENNFYRNNSASQRGGSFASDYKNSVYFWGDLFFGNKAPDGAHLHSDSDDLLDIRDCDFLSGRSTNGGVKLSDTMSYFTDVVFADNLALASGAAILMRFDVTLNVKRAIFVRNEAKFGGAVAILESTNSFVELDEAQFVDNFAQESGSALIANGQNENLNITLANSSFIGNVAERFDGTVTIDEKMGNHLKVVNTKFESNYAVNGYSAGIFMDSAGGSLRLDNCSFADNHADDDYNASSVYVEIVDGMEMYNIWLQRNESLFVRTALYVEMVENQFDEYAMVTLLNVNPEAIGSLLFEANSIHSTTFMRSFPVSMGLEIVENKATFPTEICPKCKMAVVVNGTDIYGNEYSPLQWCDSHKACYDVELQWVEDTEEVFVDLGTDRDFYNGEGLSEFYLGPLKKHEIVDVRMECAAPTDVWHVCEFNYSLGTTFPVADCPKNNYERDAGAGLFECEKIGSMSADNYAIIAKDYFWIFLVVAGVVALFVAFLYGKDKGVVPGFKVLCCDKRVEGAAIWAPAIYAWHCFDFLSDVNLTQSLFRVYYHSDSREFGASTNWQWFALAILSAVFVAAPFGLNVAFAWKLPTFMRANAPKNTFAQEFVRDKAKVVAFACLWSGNLYATLQLLNSRILGINQMYMGLTKAQMHAFLKFRVYNVWAENFPQLLIQVLALIKDATDGDDSNLSIAVLLSFLSSLFSAAAIMFEKGFAESAPTAKVDFEVTMEVGCSLESVHLPRKDFLGFMRNQHRFRKVARALCADLGVELSQLQMGYTSLKGSGCVVYGQITADAAQNMAKLEQRTFDIIWKEVFCAYSAVSGTFKILTKASASTSPPKFGARVLSLSMDDDIYVEPVAVVQPTVVSAAVVRRPLGTVDTDARDTLDTARDTRDSDMAVVATDIGGVVPITGVTALSGEGEIRSVEDAAVENFCTKYGREWEKAARKVFRSGFETGMDMEAGDLHADFESSSEESSSEVADAAAASNAPIALEMAQLTTDE